MAITRRT